MTKPTAELDTQGITRLACAVIRQAATDLKSPCQTMRREAAEFFTRGSPWLAIAEIHPDFARKRLWGTLRDVRAERRCRGLKNRKRGLQCPVCKTMFTD